jgi:hypothetical protein
MYATYGLPADDPSIQGFAVLPWLIWCAGVVVGFLIGVAVHLLSDPTRDCRYGYRQYPAELPARPDCDQTDEGPPEGPPIITCSTRIELPRAYWDLLDGRLKITLRN